MRIDFHPSAGPTLGVEWEFALVDAETGDLVSAADDLLGALAGRLDERRLHRELLRNTVEVVTGVCDTVADAVADLRQTLDVVLPAAGVARDRPVRRARTRSRSGPRSR